jgi:transcriptional regulator EpsA
MEDEILIRSRAELDTLLVNIEAAVKVNRRSDFFSWVQGVFQGILAHEVLICALAEPGSRAYRMEWMSSQPIEESRFAELSAMGDGLVHRLISFWERSGRRPLMLDTNTPVDWFGRSLVEDIVRLELENVLAHGVPDAEGRASGFFSFSRVAGSIHSAQAVTLELITPYLHAAWARANCAPGNEVQPGNMPAREILTVREAEILNWVEQGKSNGEIALILSISHLTVKNHVQKILRKLKVQNRAQAVAKGITLNLTRPHGHGQQRQTRSQ